MCHPSANHTNILFVDFPLKDTLQRESLWLSCKLYLIDTEVLASKVFGLEK